MNRLLLPLVLVSLAGCGHKNIGTGRDSAAPAYAPPATTSNDAAVEDQKADAPEAADEDGVVNAEPSASSLPDEEMTDDDSQAGDTAVTDAEAGVPDSDTDRTAAAEEPAAEPTDGGAASSSQRNGSGVKLFRGLANSVSRAVMKTFAEPRAAPAPPAEDDPFPNGEPADADPDLNR